MTTQQGRHTPMPWKAEKFRVKLNNLPHDAEGRAMAYHITSPSPDGMAGLPASLLIATVFAHQDQHNTENIALITAAPELLEALSTAAKLLREISRYVPKSIKNADRFHLENVLANTIGPAIAKATA